MDDTMSSTDLIRYISWLEAKGDTPEQILAAIKYILTGNMPAEDVLKNSVSN